MFKKFELITDWKKAYRFWSIKVGLLGTALMSVFTAWPDSALYFWGAIPLVVLNMLPERAVSIIALFIFAMSIIARIVKQQKPPPEDSEDQSRAPRLEPSSR